MKIKIKMEKKMKRIINITMDEESYQKISSMDGFKKDNVLKIINEVMENEKILLFVEKVKREKLTRQVQLSNIDSKIVDKLKDFCNKNALNYEQLIRTYFYNKNI